MSTIATNRSRRRPILFSRSLVAVLTCILIVVSVSVVVFGGGGSSGGDLTQTPTPPYTANNGHTISHPGGDVSSTPQLSPLPPILSPTTTPLVVLFVGDSLTQGIGRVMWSYREALILKMEEGARSKETPSPITYVGSHTRPCLIAQPNESYYSREEVRAGKQPRGRKEWTVSSPSEKQQQQRGGSDIIQSKKADDIDNIPVIDDYERLLSNRNRLTQDGVIPPAIGRHLDRLAAFGSVNTHYNDLGALPLSPLSLHRHEGYCGRTSANVVKGLTAAVSRRDAAFPLPPTLLNIHIGTNDAVSVARLCKIKEAPKFFHQAVEWSRREKQEGGEDRSSNNKKGGVLLEVGGKHSATSEYFLSEEFDDMMRTWSTADGEGVKSLSSSSSSTVALLDKKKAMLKRYGVDMGRSYTCARKLLAGSKSSPEDASNNSPPTTTTPPPTVFNSILGIVAQAQRLHIQHHHHRKKQGSGTTTTTTANNIVLLNVVIGVPPPLRLPAAELALEEAVRTACDELNDPHSQHHLPTQSNISSTKAIVLIFKLRCVVVAIPQYSWVISKDTVDTVHPSYSGAKKLADIWHHTLTVNKFL